jgi:carboxyl-terminal processing protease
MKMKKPYIKLIAAAGAIVLMSAAAPFSDKFFEIAKNIELFSNVYKEINTHYVDDLDPSRMMKIGVDAMLEALDPYTRYISEADVESYRLSTEGKYEGIGARISKIEDHLVVTDIYQNSPAEKAGLKIADKVVAVNGQSAVGKNGPNVMQFLRGAPGTDVDIKIMRPGETEFQTVTLTREEISLPSVPYSGMVGDSFAYASLKAFTPACGNDVMSAFKGLDEENDVKGFILDLRNNGGGLLSEAVNICNIFIPQGQLVVSTRSKVKTRNKSYSTTLSAFDTDRPLIVLINKNSASASEIVSGTIQDYDRGVLMGQLSFGKGLVQNTKEIGYNSRVKITTAKYYIPSGRCIQAVKYENGEPVDLPDSLRASFTTTNGRKVLDGGGVKPDIELTPIDDNDILKFLGKQGVIFNFVTDYLLANPMDTIASDFAFNDFDRFLTYFNAHRGAFISPVEKQLIALSEKAEKADVDEIIDTDIAEIEAKLSNNEMEEILAYKEVILNMISLEIVKRIDLDQGLAAYQISTDSEVAEAIALLKDQERYKDILAKRE